MAAFYEYSSQSFTTLLPVQGKESGGKENEKPALAWEGEADGCDSGSGQEFDAVSSEERALTAAVAAGLVPKPSTMPPLYIVSPYAPGSPPDELRRLYASIEFALIDS